MPSFSALRADHVLSAIEYLDRGGESAFSTPTKYLMVLNGRAYAPKAVVGAAFQIAMGTALTREDLSGGWLPSQANGVLDRLGFKVVEKQLSVPLSRWWVIGIGEDHEAWPLFHAKSCIAHRGTGLGDLHQFKTKEEVQDAIV